MVIKPICNDLFSIITISTQKIAELTNLISKVFVTNHVNKLSFALKLA
jgi:hypothetical protein